MRAVFVMLLATCSAIASAASNPDFGMRGGARALGQAEVGAAILGGWEALFWNPAGLAGGEGYQAGAGHTDWLGLSSETLGVTGPLGAGAFGLSGSYNGSPDLAVRDAQGQEIGSLKYNSLGGQAAYAHAFGALQMGAGLGWWQQTLAATAQQGVNLNAGALWTAGGLKLGAAGFQLESKPSLQGSLGYEFGPENFKVGVNGGFISEGPDSRWGVGGQLLIRSSLALRGGYQVPSGISAVAGLNGLTLGLGLEAGAFGFDYAYLPVGDLGQVQRFQMDYRFQSAREDVVKVKPTVPNIEPTPIATPVPTAEPTPVVSLEPTPMPKKEVRLKFVVPSE